MIVVVVKAKCLIRKHLTVNMSEKIRVLSPLVEFIYRSYRVVEKSLHNPFEVYRACAEIRRYKVSVKSRIIARVMGPLLTY